jgi:NAD-dependent isocitrate dehydrogenase
MPGQPHRVTVIPGDGVGPEVVRSAQRIIAAAGVATDWETAEAGAEVFRRGDTSGVPQATRDSIARTRVVLKGPLETPVGFGEKSANVTLRKLFETYANVRPARELPGVPTRYAGEGVDMIIVRENIEDLYAGIEHMQTADVAQCLKIITRKGSEKIIRYAFELARREGRRKVTCATKANIMKLTEGLFKRVFEELSAEYPEIVAEHLIIDNVAHQMAKDPAQFDIIVTTNLNGDIISDLASGLVGGLGFAPSGNYGDDVAIFEAVHGSAPKYAGKDVINPTALILSSLMMLRHLGESDAADRSGPRDARGGPRGHPGPGPPDGRRCRAGSLHHRLHGHHHREPGPPAGDRPAAPRVGAAVRGGQAAPPLDLRPRALRVDGGRAGRRGHLHRVRRPAARDGPEAGDARRRGVPAAVHLQPGHGGLPGSVDRERPCPPLPLSVRDGARRPSGQ